MSAPVERVHPAASGPPPQTRSHARLREIAARRLAQSTEVPTRFFADHADAIANACLAMARRFERGGRLLVFGLGAEATDALHVSVEFVHPVLVGKRALPAIALTTDTSLLTAAGNDLGFDEIFARQVEALARAGDLLIIHSTSGNSPNVLRAAEAARERGVP